MDDLIVSAAFKSGSIIKTGAGELFLNGNTANNALNLTVNGGTVILNQPATTGAIGGLVIGDGVGTDIVRLGGNNQVSDSNLVTVESSGTFDLNGFSDTIGGLVVAGGQLTTGAGTLKLSGSVTSDASAAGGGIAGNLDLGGIQRIFAISDGPSASDLDVAATLSNGTFRKVSAGTLRFTSAAINTYAGGTLADEGVLALARTTADASVPGNLTIGTSSGVAAVVRLDAAEQISAAPGALVTLNSTGTLDLNGFNETILDLNVNGGQLTTGAGVLTITGTVTNGFGLQTLGGNIGLGGATRTFNVINGAAGDDLIINGSIQNGGVTKTGIGQLVFAGALVLNKSVADGAIAGSLVITGGTVRLTAGD